MVITDSNDRLITQQILYKTAEQYLSGSKLDRFANWLDQATDRQLGKLYDPFFGDFVQALQQGKIVVNDNHTPWGFLFI